MVGSELFRQGLPTELSELVEHSNRAIQVRAASLPQKMNPPRVCIVLARLFLRGGQCAHGTASAFTRTTIFQSLDRSTGYVCQRSKPIELRELDVPRGVAALAVLLFLFRVASLMRQEKRK